MSGHVNSDEYIRRIAVGVPAVQTSPFPGDAGNCLLARGREIQLRGGALARADLRNHWSILTPEMERALTHVDARTYEANLTGTTRRREK